MIKHIFKIINIYLLIFYTRYYFILKNQKITKHKTNQYKKKNSTTIKRGRIFDKNKKILQYSTYKYNKKKQIEYKRKYCSQIATLITGIVNFENQGISGLEQYYNSYLETKSIIKYNDKLFLGEQNTAIKIPKNGKDLYTTINTNQSELVYNTLKTHTESWESQFATAIIMDGLDGSIETIAQYPYFSTIENDNTDQNIINFMYPLAINNSYEMGSVIKIFLMAAALESKIVTPDTQINCFNVKKKNIQGIPLTTWKADGIIPFSQVIKESNNFGVLQIGIILGKNLYDYYKSFGFGDKLAIPFIGQSNGFLNNPTKWSKRTPISLSFGYEMRASLLQIASAITIFINHGSRVIPKFLTTENTKLIKTKCEKKSTEEGKKIIEFDNKKLIQFGQKIPENCKLYGKTGTANLLTNGIYDPTKNAYVFVGFIEYKNQIKVIGLYTYLSNKSNVYSSHVSLPTICKIINIVCNIIDKETLKN